MPNPTAEMAAVSDLLAEGGVVVLSGAGLSTESGIPDYRGPSGSLRRRAPMTYQAFMSDPVARHRYWARSYIGWRQIAAARPNAGHLAVTALQQHGVLDAIITQNVDGLHQAAGSREVIELHGGLHHTLCLTCGHRAPRGEVNRRLDALNRRFDPGSDIVNPDGDAEIADADLDGFVMVDCAVCGGGPLKPDVVFFGENVPRERVRRCFQLVQDAKALLVLGSSLTVMSGLRFVRRAAEYAIPVVIINQGPTRGDELATVLVDEPLGEVLPQLVPALAEGRLATGSAPAARR